MFLTKINKSRDSCNASIFEEGNVFADIYLFFIIYEYIIACIRIYFKRTHGYGLILLFKFMFIPPAYSGEITVRQIPVAGQLPSNTVCRMFQDSDGFVWLGTEDGFCRYDGYDMTSFRSEIASPTFPSNYIMGGFAEDTLNQTIWIGTEKGVLILDKHTHAITLPATTADLELVRSEEFDRDSEKCK
jgi:hypothetical protein